MQAYQPTRFRRLALDALTLVTTASADRFRVEDPEIAPVACSGGDLDRSGARHRR